MNIVDIALADCMRYKVFTSEECKLIADRAKTNCLGLTNAQHKNPVFAHLDFHWKNIFYDSQRNQIMYVFDFGSSMSTVDYMGYYRLDDGFLYGTEKFYTNSISCPLEITDAEKENAWLYNTLDYLTFLAFNGKDKNQEDIKRIRNELGI